VTIGASCLFTSGGECCRLLIFKSAQLNLKFFALQSTSKKKQKTRTKESE